MGRRTYFLFFFYSCTLSASAELVASQNNIVPPVVVKAVKQRSTTITSAQPVIITRQQIAATGITTLAQALQALGGIQLQNMAGNNSQVLLGMRGFGANASSNTLMLINGIPLTNPDLAPPDLNVIPLHAIERVEIIAGSESVLYGDQAVGGIINIITQKNSPEKVAVICNSGSFNQQNCYVTVNSHYAHINHSLAVNVNRTDNYRVHNDYNQNLLVGNLAYTYQTGTLHFNYNLANETLQYPGALTAAQVRQNRRQANNDIDYFTDWNGFFHLREQHALNDRWQLDTNLSRRQMHGHGVLYSPFKQSRLIYFFRPQLQGKVYSILLTSGVNLESDNYHLGSPFGLTNNHQQKFGAFGIATFPLREKLSLSAGMRAAEQVSYLQSGLDTDTINRVWVSTIGATYQLNPSTALYLRRAGSFRFPKADEMASVPMGVASLRAQRGIAYETGMKLNAINYHANLGLYQLNLRDEIAFDPMQTPEQPFGANRNLPPTIRRGFTLSGKKDLTEKISLGGQYNYVNAIFQNGVNSGKRIPLVSENIIRADADYRFAPNWNIYLEAILTGNQYAANDDANIAGKLGSFTVYNVNLRYHFKTMELSLRVNNIFAKPYYFYTVYQPSLQSEFFYPAPERNFTLTFKYLFM